MPLPESRAKPSLLAPPNLAASVELIFRDKKNCFTFYSDDEVGLCCCTVFLSFPSVSSFHSLGYSRACRSTRRDGIRQNLASRHAPILARAERRNLRTPKMSMVWRRR
jgi:hypothetical protein